MQAALVGELKLLGVDVAPRRARGVVRRPGGLRGAKRGRRSIAKLCELGRERAGPGRRARRGGALQPRARVRAARPRPSQDRRVDAPRASLARPRRTGSSRVVLVSAALGTGAFFVTRALRRSPVRDRRRARPLPSLRAASPATQATEAPVDHAPPTPPHPRSVGAPLPHPAAVKTVERKITIGATLPSSSASRGDRRCPAGGGTRRA